MESEGTPTNNGVLHRVKSWFKPRPYTPSRLRNYIMEFTITVTSTEVTVYLLLQMIAAAGQIPFRAPDAILCCIAFVEALAAPFVAKLTSWRPRGMVLFWEFLLIACLLPLFFLQVPDIQLTEDSVLCGAQENLHITGNKTTRPVVTLMACVILGITCVLGRVSIWSYGIAYLDRIEPSKICSHIGNILLNRILPLLVLQYVSTEIIWTWLWIHIITIIIPVLRRLLIPVIFRFEEYDHAIILWKDKQCVFSSILRVITNTTTVTQMLSISLAAAGVWGFMHNQNDVLKVKYFEVKESIAANYLAQLLCTVLFMGVSVKFYGHQYSEPILTSFSKTSALRRAAIFGVITCALIIATTTVGCETTPAAGLSEDKYSQPTCSLQCGCIEPGDQLDPVCDVVTMTSYLSPCHAGCVVNETVNGLRVFSNCSCAAGRVTLGACRPVSCSWSVDLHTALSLFAVILSVLMFQTLIVVMLRSIPTEDKPVALGVLSAILALVVFVSSTILYMFVLNGNHCVWFSSGKCQLHDSRFPKIVAYTSAGFVSISVFISIITFFIKWRAEKKEDKPNKLSGTFCGCK